MKVLLKVMGGLVALVLLAAGAGIGFLSLKTPAQRPAPNEKVEPTELDWRSINARAGSPAGSSKG